MRRPQELFPFRHYHGAAIAENFPDFAVAGGQQSIFVGRKNPQGLGIESKAEITTTSSSTALRPSAC
jgi:hypothetical protein